MRPRCTGDLDFEMDGELVVAKVGGQPHLEVPARLEVRHKEVPGNAVAGGRPGHWESARRLRGAQPVAQVEHVRAGPFADDVDDPHAGLVARSHVLVGEGFGRERLPVERGGVDLLAQVEHRAPGRAVNNQLDGRGNLCGLGGQVEAHRGCYLLDVDRDRQATVQPDRGRGRGGCHKALVGEGTLRLEGRWAISQKRGHLAPSVPMST